MTDTVYRIIEENSALWTRLRESTVVVTTRPGRPVAFHLEPTRRQQAGHLAETGVTPDELEALCASLRDNPPATPCVIDVIQAASLMREQGPEASEALRRSRVRYQGTDGVRGKVRADRADVPALAALVEEGAFTPGVCELLSAAFVACGPEATPTAVLVEDGRDAFGEREFSRATARGFTRCGCRAIDLGIAPTPMAPVAAAMLDAELAAVVTASHNPADQNGVKFFRSGRKPLPEPGDYEISARAFLLQAEGLPDATTEDKVETIDAVPLVRRFFDSALAEEDVQALRGVHLIVDVAHGAFAPFAGDLLRRHGLDGEVLNADMTGENINRDSGVAYLEGRDHIAAEEAAGDITFVQRMWQGQLVCPCDSGRTDETQGQQAAPATVAEQEGLSERAVGPVIGIALDGDGDRAMLAVCDPKSEEVRLIDGDRIAHIITRLAAEAGETGDRIFAGTVESDLAVFEAVEDLGVETVMTPVGDKWLSATPELAERLLVGEEASGHLVWPVEVNGRTIVTGNGMLSGLRGAAAIRRLKLSPTEAAGPFAPGVVRTFYTYFVDRSRFHRDSPVWREDLRIAHERLASLQTKGMLGEDVTLRGIVFDDDPDMLYLRVEEADRAIGALFARNSGTENKTATYARGSAAFDEPLVALARAVNDNHIRMMKDETLVETRAERALLAALDDTGGLSIEAARTILKEHGIAGEAGLSAMLFALAREGLARRTGDRIRKVV